MTTQRFRRLLQLLAGGALLLVLGALCVRAVAPAVLSPFDVPRPPAIGGWVFSGPWTVGEYVPNDLHMGTFYGVTPECGTAAEYELNAVSLDGIFNPSMTLELHGFAEATTTVQAGDEIVLPDPCGGPPKSIGKVITIEPDLWFIRSLLPYKYHSHQAVLELYDSWLTAPESLRSVYQNP